LPPAIAVIVALVTNSDALHKLPLLLLALINTPPPPLLLLLLLSAGPFPCKARSTGKPDCST
jgi:hypothetical protein